MEGGTAAVKAEAPLRSMFFAVDFVGVNIAFG